jgi:anti-sigma B factor antagonist
MPHPYEVRVSDSGTEQVQIEVRGEIDMAVAPQLLDAILCAALSRQREDIVIDLAECTFIDSAGLAALVQAHRRLVAESCHLVITRASPVIAATIELAGLDDYLDVRPGWMSRRIAN